jgi:hypothetical protein
MLTYGYLADGLFTLSEANVKNELDRYCKMEGMDYTRLAAESNSLKNLFRKRKYSRLETVNSNLN